MDLILLPGNSVTNKDWAEATERALLELFTTTHIQYYDHWRTGEPIIDLDRELTKLAQMAKPLGDYTVLAKSFGVVLTLRALYEKKIAPKKAIFLGSAIASGRALWPDVDKWLAKLVIPTLFIQQTADPVMAARELEALLKRKNLPNVQFREIPGHDHGYTDFPEIKLLVMNFIQQ